MGEPLTIKCKLVGPDSEPIEDYIRAIADRIHEARAAGSKDAVKVDVTLTADKRVGGPT